MDYIRINSYTSFVKVNETYFSSSFGVPYQWLTLYYDSLNRSKIFVPFSADLGILIINFIVFYLALKIVLTLVYLIIDKVKHFIEPLQ